MRFKAGADVHNHAGEKIGRLKGVVMEPDNETVAGIIVERGFLFTEDRMIPVAWIAQTSEDGNVRLSEDQRAQDAPHVDVNEYRSGAVDTTPAGVEAAPALFYYTAPGFAANSGSAAIAPALYAKAQTNDLPGVEMPDDRMTLRVGADVRSSDDEKIGKVEEIIANAADNTVTHFVVERGAFYTTKKMIDMQWVTSIGEDDVLLSVNHEFIERLPDHDKALDPQGEMYATQHDADNMNDTDDGLIMDERATTASTDDTRPRRPDHADKTGVETSRSRDWERTGSVGEEVTMPDDADDNAEYQRGNERPIQGT